MTSFLLSYILRDVSFTEVDRVCRVAFREPIHLCTCVREVGGDGEVTCSETPSLLSYTLRDVSFTEVGRVCRVPFREPMHLCTCVSEEGGDGEAVCSETPSLLSYTVEGVLFIIFCVDTSQCSMSPVFIVFFFVRHQNLEEELSFALIHTPSSLFIVSSAH